MFAVTGPQGSNDGDRSASSVYSKRACVYEVGFSDVETRSPDKQEAYTVIGSVELLQKRWTRSSVLSCNAKEKQIQVC